jgi:hypothetical protein
MIWSNGSRNTAKSQWLGGADREAGCARGSLVSLAEGSPKRRGPAPVTQWRLLIRDHSALSSKARLVGMILATYMANYEVTCYVGYETLQQAAGLSRGSVWSAITELEDAGLLEHRRGGHSRCNYYCGLLGLEGSDAGSKKGPSAKHKAVVSSSESARQGFNSATKESSSRTPTSRELDELAARRQRSECPDCHGTGAIPENLEDPARSEVQRCPRCCKGSSMRNPVNIGGGAWASAAKRP